MTPEHVAGLVKTGALKGYRAGKRVYRVLAEDFEAFLLERLARQARASRYPKRDAAWWQAYRDHHSDE